VDELLVKARAEPSVEARKGIYTQVATLFRDEGPIVAPYFLNYITAGRANMKGFEPHPIRWLVGCARPRTHSRRRDRAHRNGGTS
jgi:ABC-type transport system substrate-binding protein